MTDTDTKPEASDPEAARLERVRNMQRLVDQARASGNSTRTSAEMRESVRRKIAAIKAAE